MNGKYSITLLFSLAEIHDPPIAIVKKLKGSRTCLIGYSGFISHELRIINSLGADTHTHTHTHTHPLLNISAPSCL